MLQGFHRTLEISTILLIILSFNLLVVPRAFAQDTNYIKVFPINSKPFGLSYEDHVINNWKIILSNNQTVNPLTDPTGERCTYGQNLSNTSIFYLPTNTEGTTKRVCKIPSGLGIFIPIIMVEISTKEDPTATPAGRDQKATRDQDNVATLKLKIDNKEFEDEELRVYRIHTKDFQVEFPADAMMGVTEPGPANVIADGYHVIIEPLPKGEHIIYTSGVIPCYEECTEQSINYLTEVETRLIVE